MKIVERNSCRASNGKLCEVFDLGFLPISCFPLPEDPIPEKHPLKLAFNQDSGLLQLCHSIDPDEMYSQYWYMSGVNQSMRSALKSIADQAMARSRNLQPGDIALDIASNDGTLLSAYPCSLFRVGIDPAKNIKPQSCDLHINTYFSRKVFQQALGDKKAKIITSIAMFYDLEDPIQFSKEVADILHPDGLWIIELSYLPTMLQKNSFDTICGEHLEYYSLRSIEPILSKAHLKIEDVELNDVNGGSFRVYVRHARAAAEESESLKQLRLEEAKHKLLELQTYIDFKKRVEKNKDEMVQFLHEQKRLGKKVLGYGASTKGNTIMAYYEIGPDLVPFVADRNPIKWGRQTVTRIPIISEEEARKMKPDYFLAFPYHFMNEFLQRETDFLQNGGKFISPIPHLSFHSLAIEECTNSFALDSSLSLHQLCQSST